MDSRLVTETTLMDNTFLYHMENMIIQQLNILRLDFKEEMQTLWTKIATLVKEDKANNCNFNQDAVLESKQGNDELENDLQNSEQLVDVETTKSLVVFKETDLNNDVQIPLDLDDTQQLSITDLKICNIAENVVPWHETIKVEIFDDYLTEHNPKSSIMGREAFSLPEMYFGNQAEDSNMNSSTTSIVDQMSVVSDASELLLDSENSTSNKIISKNEHDKQSLFQNSKFLTLQNMPSGYVIKCEDVDKQVSMETKKCIKVPHPINAIETVQSTPDQNSNLVLYDHESTFCNKDLSIYSKFGSVYQQKNSYDERSTVQGHYSTQSKTNNSHQDSVLQHKTKESADSLEVLKVKSLSDAGKSCNIKQRTRCTKQQRSNRFLRNLHCFRCQVCFKKLSSKHALLYHLNTHNKNRFKCQVCNEVFTYKLSFYRHIQAHKKGYFPCAICGKVFNNAVTFQAHQSIHARSPIKVSSGKKPCHQKSKSSSHLPAICNDGHNTCALCNKTFPTRLKLQTHMKIHVMKTRSAINRKLRYNLRKVNM